MSEIIKFNNIYFHLSPKCGYTFVENFMKYFEKKLLLVNNKIPVNILFYRCPYRRLISLYLSLICNCNYGGGIDNKINKMLLNFDPNKPKKLLYNDDYKHLFEDEFIGDISFNEFIDILIKCDKDKLERHIKHQFYNYTLSNSKFKKRNYDFIINTDTINSDIIPFLDYLNITENMYNNFIKNNINKFNKTIQIKDKFSNNDNNFNDSKKYYYDLKKSEIIKLGPLPNNHYDLFLNNDIKMKIKKYFDSDFNIIDIIKNN